VVKILFGNNRAVLEIRRQAWLRMQRQGKLSYVLRRGVLLWGGSMFVLFACWNAYQLRDHLDKLPVLLALNAVIWSLGGMSWGLWTWHSCEKRFRNELPQDSINEGNASN
jgi:hypothetical protein